jgi:hypothetical protein
MKIRIAARLSSVDPFVRFTDAAIHRDTAERWVFELFRGSASDALGIAMQINVDPYVLYEARDDRSRG